MKRHFFRINNSNFVFDHTWKTAKNATLEDGYRKGVIRLPKNYSWFMFARKCNAQEITEKEYMKCLGI